MRLWHKRVVEAQKDTERAKIQYQKAVRQRGLVRRLNRNLTNHEETNHITQLILTAVRNAQ